VTAVRPVTPLTKVLCNANAAPRCDNLGVHKPLTLWLGKATGHEWGVRFEPQGRIPLSDAGRAGAAVQSAEGLKLTGGERVLDIGSSPRQSWSANRLTMVRLKGG
jgi:hypothetical protein